jgi:hypothetical protein
MFRRLLVVGALAGALAIFAVPAATANNGATTTKLGTVSYTDGGFGPVTCSGANVTKTGPMAFIKDDENCTVLDPSQAILGPGVYTIGVDVGWNSDFSSGGSAGKAAVSGTVTVTDNGNGTWNEHIVAYY